MSLDCQSDYEIKDFAETKSSLMSDNASCKGSQMEIQQVSIEIDDRDDTAKESAQSEVEKTNKESENVTIQNAKPKSKSKTAQVNTLKASQTPNKSQNLRSGIAVPSTVMRTISDTQQPSVPKVTRSVPKSKWNDIMTTINQKKDDSKTPKMKSTKPDSRTKSQKVPSLSHRNEIALAVSHQSINHLSNKLEIYEATDKKVQNTPSFSTPHKISASSVNGTKAIAPASTAKASNKNTVKSEGSTIEKLNNNKENNDFTGLPNKTLGRVYKSRDGLTAFSSNTSIMSEVSNISKSSLPVASMSNTIASSCNIGNQSLKVPNTVATKFTKNTTLVNSTNNGIISRKRLIIEPASSSNNSSTHNINGLMQKKTNSVATPQITGGLAKKNLILSVNSTSTAKSVDAKLVKKPGVLTSGDAQADAKWTNEIKRLEALCESRTKELNMLKLQLKQTLVAFDSIAVAFKFVSHSLDGFASPYLKAQLETMAKKHDEEIKYLNGQIDDKENCVQLAQKTLNEFVNKFNENKVNYEIEIDTLKVKQKNDMDQLKGKLNKENETNVKNLNNEIDVLKVDNQSMVNQLHEHLYQLQELREKLKTCEEELACTRDERISKLKEGKRTLEREIESLKTAIDIKNKDIADLRTRNNELYTKCENFDEIQLRCDQYKCQIEQLNEAIRRRREEERRVSEQNRQLAQTIDVKNREHLRLSMQYEELQYRLQSQPNLSTEVYDEEENENPSCMTTNLNSNNASTPANHYATSVVKLRSKSLKTTPANNSSAKKHSYLIGVSNFSNNSSMKIQHFRPVSESFDFNIDRDAMITRSMFENDSEINTSQDEHNMTKSVPCINITSENTNKEIEVLDVAPQEQDRANESSLSIQSSEDCNEIVERQQELMLVYE